MSRQSSKESGTGKREGRNIRENANAVLKLSFVIEGLSRTIWTGRGCRDRTNSWNLHQTAV